MRYIATALDNLSGESIRKVTEEQFKTNAHRKRGQPRRMKLVAHKDEIQLEDAALEEAA